MTRSFPGKLFVPAETELVVSIYELQRNKKIWGNLADEFNPDNFLPENIESKHVYSFIPYSAGSRNCIGIIKIYCYLLEPYFYVQHFQERNMPRL